MSAVDGSHLSPARQAIAATRLFAGLPEEVLDALARHMVAHTYSAGQVICLGGEAGERVYLLEKGWAKAVCTALDGREQAALFLRDGDVFGDEAVFSAAPSPLTVIALEDARVWTIDGAVLVGLSRRYPDLALASLAHLGQRVLYYIQMVEDLGLRSVQERIAHTLWQHAELQDGQWIIPRRPWTTLAEMAVRLGTVRDVLSRSISKLEAEGVLRMERSRIVILDPEKLLELGRV